MNTMTVVAMLTKSRDMTCAVVLADAVISRRHATIVREGALYFLEDLNSSYGTRVNGAAVRA